MKKEFDALIQKVNNFNQPELLFALIQTCWQKGIESINNNRFFSEDDNDLQVFSSFATFILLNANNLYSDLNIATLLTCSKKISDNTIKELIESFKQTFLQHITKSETNKGTSWLSEENQNLYRQFTIEFLYELESKVNDKKDLKDFKKKINSYIEDIDFLTPLFHPPLKAPYIIGENQISRKLLIQTSKVNDFTNRFWQMSIIFNDRVYARFVESITEAEQTSQRFLKLLHDTRLNKLNVYQIFLNVYGITPDEFIESCWEIWTYLKNQNGILDFHTLKGNKNEKLLIKVIQLLMLTGKEICDAYSDLYSNLHRLPPPLFYDSFIKKPFYQISNYVICPSPIVFLSHISWTLSILTRNIMKKNGDYEDALGNALSHYLKEYVKFNNKSLNLIDLDSSQTSNKATSEQKADFILETENSRFIVELKKSLGLRSPNYNPQTLVNTWQRIYGALEQSAASKINNLTQKKSYVLIVVDEIPLLESLPFLLFAQSAKMLQSFDISLENMSIISVNMLEQLVKYNKLEEYLQFSGKKAHKFLITRQAGDLRDFIMSEHLFKLQSSC